MLRCAQSHTRLYQVERKEMKIRVGGMDKESAPEELLMEVGI